MKLSEERCSSDKLRITEMAKIARDITRAKAQDLAVLVVDTEKAGRAFETLPFKVDEQVVHPRSITQDRAPDGFTNPDYTGRDPTAFERNFHHTNLANSMR
jgi:hypothetical protein